MTGNLLYGILRRCPVSCDAAILNITRDDMGIPYCTPNWLGAVKLRRTAHNVVLRKPGIPYYELYLYPDNMRRLKIKLCIR